MNIRSLSPEKKTLYVPSESVTMSPKRSLDLLWNFWLLSLSEWPWRRWKDFNPQWNFLIPATCHRVHWLHTDAGASQWAPNRRHFSLDRRDDSLHRSTSDSTTGFISGLMRDGWSCWQWKFWPEWGGGTFWRSLRAFVWLKVLLLREPTWPVLHPCCFCFQAWEHLGFASGLTKKSLNCISPGPLPPFPTCKAASHLHQNEELQGQNVFAIFLWLWRGHVHICIFLWSALKRSLTLIKMLPSDGLRWLKMQTAFLLHWLNYRDPAQWLNINICSHTVGGLQLHL